MFENTKHLISENISWVIIAILATACILSMMYFIGLHQNYDIIPKSKAGITFITTGVEHCMLPFNKNIVCYINYDEKDAFKEQSVLVQRGDKWLVYPIG